jgi:hypothetical protein
MILRPGEVRAVCFSLWCRKNDIRFHVTDENKILSALLFSPHLHVLSNVDAFSLRVPSFVIVTGDQVSGDAFALRIIFDEVIDLPSIP